MSNNGLSVRGVHYNQLLQGLSIAYRPYGMIAEQVVTVVPVKKESDAFLKWNKGDALRSYKTIRADGTRANQIIIGHDKDVYVTEEYALEFQLTDRMLENADSQLSLELAMTRATQDAIKLDQERRVSTIYRATSSYASTNRVTLSGTDQWNNASYSGSIEKVFDDAKEAVRLQTANNAPQLFAIIPKPVSLVIKRDAKVRDLVKHTHADLVVDGDLPPVLWNTRVVIPTVVGNSNNTEVFDTDAFTASSIWGNDVVLTFKGAPAKDTFMHIAIFRRHDLMVEQWREDAVSSNWYRVKYNQGEKLVSDVGGYLIKDAIA